ncbi:MAG: type ISP restriction/modification enzyme, partial [Crinalium sp.]
MAKIYHADLWGSREDKYRYLTEHDITTVKWTEIFPKSPFYLFCPQDRNLLEEYDQGWKITEILPVHSVGIVTARDNLTIKCSPQEVETTVKDFVSLPIEEARIKYELGDDARDWKVSLAQEDLRNNSFQKSNIVPIIYRPFDTRYTYYTGQTRGFICMPRPEVMSNMLKENLALISARSNKSQDCDHFYCSQFIMETKCGESTTQSCLFPLYTYPNTKNQQGNLFIEKSPNLSSDFIAAIRAKLGYIPTPEAIFYYIYAIFHSPTYRQRYAEFLKIDFPRVPLTSNDRLFKDL